MDEMYFGCERGFIEQIRRVGQQNMLIDLYCTDSFAFLNFVDLYYRALGQNAILMFLVTCAVYPILFMCVAFVAESYLAVSIQGVSKRLNLSPTIAALTLVALANGSPDLLNSLSTSTKDGGALISLGSVYGGFISSLTLVLSNVVWNAGGEVKLPKIAILKELSFYLISILVVAGYGIKQTVDYSFVIVNLVIYGLYILASIAIERRLLADTKAADEQEFDGDAADHHGADHQGQIGKPEAGIHIGDSENTGEEKSKDLFNLMIEEITNAEATFLENLVLIPLAIIGMLTVSYLQNPLMQSGMKYIIVGISAIWIILSMEILDNEIHINLMLGFLVSLLFIGLEFTNVSNDVKDTGYELVSVFASIGWIKILTAMIIDFITFMAFYFNINEVILSAILLSAGNIVGDFFGNGALAKAGSPVMAAVASYSSQTFNALIAFSVTIMANSHKVIEFDIFGMTIEEDADPDKVKAMPIENKFMIVVLALSVFIITLQLIYFFSHSFVIRKKFTYILTTVYVAFFGGSLFYGYAATRS